MIPECLYSDEEVRDALKEKIKGRKQIDVAKEIGISSTFLSQALHTDVVTGKILKWLGFKRGPRFYVREQ